MTEIRCRKCGKQLALKLVGELVIYCPRCKYVNVFTVTLDNVPRVVLRQ